MGANISSLIRRFGVWESRSINVSYYAITDGAVHAFGSTVNNTISGYSDNMSPPTVKRNEDDNSGISGGGKSIVMNVRKGDYWRVTGANVVFWLPEL